MKITRWYLPLFFLIFYLLPLNNQPLWMPDETRYAEISREMVASGNWIVPNFLGLRYFEKPIAGYWLNSVSQVLFGDTNFAVRFASAAATGLSAWLIYFFAMRLWQCRRKAALASFIYLSSLIVYGIGTYSVLDAMVTLWLNAAMVCFYLTLVAENNKEKRRAYLLLGMVCAFGFLTKGFIALAVPVIVVVPYMLYRRRFVELLCYGPLAIISAVLWIAPWALFINQLEPDYWHYFFWVEHIQRFAADNAQHKAPFWYYFPIILLGAIPWLGLIPAALYRGWQVRAIRLDYLYLLAWIVLPFLFFSLAKGKLLTYLLPCFAPLALLIANGLQNNLQEGNHRALRLNAWVNGLFGLLCMGVILILAFYPPYAVYLVDEQSQIRVALLIFAIWSLLGWVQLRSPSKSWWLSAFCPLALGIGLPWALPQSVVNSKLPVPFVEQHKPLLENAYRILADDVGMASAVAWGLKRADIGLYDKQGELKYGLSYPDSYDRFVAKNDFPDWLQHARSMGDVILVLRTSSSVNKFDTLPPPSEIINQGRFNLLVYHQSKP